VRVRLLTSLAAILVVVGVSRAWSEDFALIRNAANPIAALTRGEVKDIAVGRKKTWPRGPVAVMVLPRPGTPELHWFATSVVGIPESVLMARIKELVFRGEMRRPIIVSSPQEMLAAVHAEPGGLGVVTGHDAEKLPAGVARLTVR
jgi:hypothetical protein